MNWDQVQGKWKQIKGDAQTHWGELTNDDLDVINGRNKSDFEERTNVNRRAKELRARADGINVPADLRRLEPRDLMLFGCFAVLLIVVCRPDLVHCGPVTHWNYGWQSVEHCDSERSRIQRIARRRAPEGSVVMTRCKLFLNEASRPPFPTYLDQSIEGRLF